MAAGRVGRHLAFVETGVLRSFLTTDEREITHEFFPASTVAGACTSFLTQASSGWALQALGSTLMTKASALYTALAAAKIIIDGTKEV